MKLPFIIAVMLLAAAGTARAQMDSREGIALQNQILDLRAQLQQLQQSQGQGAAPGGYQPSLPPPSPDQNSPYGGANPGAPVNSDTAAQLVVRVGNLEDQVRELQGKVDDLTNQLQRQNDALTKQIGDLQFKLGQGGTPPPPEPGAAPDPVQPPPVAAKPPPPQPPAQHRTAEMILHDGNAALARRDFPAAAAAAREVLANSHGPRLTDAQFLLARAEGAQGQYKESAADFYKAYQRAQKSPTGQVALLGVANALLGMNDKKDACEALAKLSAEYPHASAGVKENAAATRHRAACGR